MKGFKLAIISSLSFYLLLFFIAVGLIFAVCGNEAETSSSTETSEDATTNAIGLSQDVLRYKDLVILACNKYGIPDQVNVILAIMMQESGGRVPDVMQSSESMGFPPNSLQPPESIDAGVKYYASCLKMANGDQDTAIQSYNFGTGFISWLNDGRGGKYSLELAYEFSDYQAMKMGWKRYGDKDYVPHVKRYLSGGIPADGVAVAVMNEALKYEGDPYVWGGASPSTGFDCSGLTQYCYQVAGISLPRTAQEQYNYCQSIEESEAKAGDLVFFSGTYAGATITHVGIYQGNGKMYDSNDSGVGYSDISSGYWRQHLAGFGRPPGM
ncbi:lysozyme family protein [Listeria costaricensis]|uniref:bifunctional lytic transglycosylase/C40 family peptidase n=1 Tax=Listeria costaricensis TaxID=2026604 RepID=UPI000C07E781|nr:lysozyme family protein [Listeria costaricensis]